MFLAVDDPSGKTCHVQAAAAARPDTLAAHKRLIIDAVLELY
jgi:hypothetical protein